MKVVLFLLVNFFSFLSFSQQSDDLITENSEVSQEKIKTYNYGKDGIESIVYRKGKPTILISNFNARPELVKEVVTLVYEYFMKNLEMKSDKSISFKAKKAEVFGKIIIKKSKTAIDVQFHYEKVVWKNGLTEVYVKPKKK
jgi:hypothetical protein